MFLDVVTANLRAAAEQHKIVHVTTTAALDTLTPSLNPAPAAPDLVSMLASAAWTVAGTGFMTTAKQGMTPLKDGAHLMVEVARDYDVTDKANGIDVHAHGRFH